MIQKTRSDEWDAIAKTRYNLIVVGGGIMGVAIAREAAQRGLKTLVLEQRDFASGASGNTTKMLPGGLKEMRHTPFHYFMRTLYNKWMLQKKSSEVKPLRVLYPIYEEENTSFIKIEGDVLRYEASNLFRDLSSHRFYGRLRSLGVAAGLHQERLLALTSHMDGRIDDVRLVLETLRKAERAGAVAMNYANVVNFSGIDDKLSVIHVRDELAGKEYDVTTDAVIVAAGSWTDRIHKRIDRDAPAFLYNEKGVHIVVKGPAPTDAHALAFRDDYRDRYVHLLPWRGKTLVGGAETMFDGDLDDVHPEYGEVDYLVDIYNHYAHPAIMQHEIVSAYAAVRPLLRTRSKRAPAIGGHVIHASHSYKNLTLVYGGNLAMHRRIACEALRVAAAHGGPYPRRKHEDEENHAPIHDTTVLSETLFTNTVAETSLAVALRIEERIANNCALALPLAPTCALPKGVVHYFVEEEHAMTLDDLLTRRLRFRHTLEDGGASFAIAAAEEMATLLGWDAQRRDDEVARYMGRRTRERKALASF